MTKRAITSLLLCAISAAGCIGGSAQATEILGKYTFTVTAITLAGPAPAVTGTLTTTATGLPAAGVGLDFQDVAVPGGPDNSQSATTSAAGVATVTFTDPAPLAIGYITVNLAGTCSKNPTKLKKVGDPPISCPEPGSTVVLLAGLTTICMTRIRRA